jgi:hypothetical protein
MVQFRSSYYGSLVPLSLNTLFPRVHPCLCGRIHEDVLFPIPPGGFNFSADGALVDAWPYFTGIKVGKIYLYSLFLSLCWRWL